jgi:CRISPR type III-B/RAMP module RAMP protein Cmr6
MAKPIDKKDRDPWEKIHAIKEVKDLIGDGRSLSTSLRMSRFSPVGGKVKFHAADWMCKGVQQPRQIPLPAAASFEMKLKSRMLVNHSGGVMENATLALHPHFGTPVIPGSALKGIAGHAAWLEWMEVEEDRDLIGSIIAEVFGFPVGNKDLDVVLKSSMGTRSGAIAFLPAQVKGAAKLESDLINSHERRDNPIPVFFPAVAAGTMFEFHLMPLSLKTETDKETLMMFAEGWLKKGLSDHGAGAKTNAGYGWFEEVD